MNQLTSLDVSGYEIGSLGDWAEEQTIQRHRWARLIRSRPFLVRRGVEFPLLSVSRVLDAVAFAFDYALSTQSHGIRAEWAADFDQRFDDLWSSVAKTEASIGDPSARFLRWRFLDEPGYNNRILCLSEIKTHRLMGYLIGEVTGDQFLCRDLLIATSRRGEIGMLSRAALAIRVLGVAGISVRVVGPGHLMRALHVAGFHKRDRESVFIRTFPKGIHGHWYLTTADEDV